MGPPDLEKRLGEARLRLRARSPFFGTLTLFAELREDPACPTLATDGRDVFYNPAYLATLAPRQLDAALLHEVLHAALQHVGRRGGRDPLLWNLAADVVVNGLVAAQPHLELPPGAVRERKLEGLRVEEVYEVLRQRPRVPRVPADLREGSAPPDARARWERALAHAGALGGGALQGEAGAGLRREVASARGEALPWRVLLWRYLARTPTDYGEFDRRLIHRGLYLEALESETLSVYLAVDTSGSVTDEQLGRFLAEVRAVLGSYPLAEARLFYADAALHGPHSLAPGEAPPPPQGGGGTSFAPFFAWLEQHPPAGEAVAIYLTDGVGDFPPRAPALPVLWVVAPGGAPDEDFPFGQVARLVD